MQWVIIYTKLAGLYLSMRVIAMTDNELIAFLAVLAFLAFAVWIVYKVAK